MAVYQLGGGGRDHNFLPGQRDGGALTVPEIGDAQSRTLLSAQKAGNRPLVQPGQCNAIHGSDQISAFQAALFRRGIRKDGRNEYAVRGDLG